MRFLVFLSFLLFCCSSLYSQESTFIISQERVLQGIRANDKESQLKLDKQLAKLLCNNWNYQVVISLSNRTLVHIPTNNQRQEKEHVYIYENLKLNPFSLLTPLGETAWNYYHALHEESKSRFETAYLMRDLRVVYHGWICTYESLKKYLQVTEVQQPLEESDSFVKSILLFTKEMTGRVKAAKLTKQQRQKTSLPEIIQDLDKQARILKIFCEGYKAKKAQTEAGASATHEARKAFRKSLLIHRQILDTDAILYELRDFDRFLPSYLRHDLMAQIDQCQSVVGTLKK